MIYFAFFVIFSWIPVVLLLFAVLPPRRAVVVATITAWLFLPQMAFRIPGAPDYTKVSSTTLGLVLAALIFDAAALLRLRPRWFDLPVIVVCLSPLASSISNGLGVYDGCAGLLNTLFQWGFPYLVGRLYLSDLKGLRALAMGIIIGGLIYIPICLFEIRFSPQTHRLVYGYTATWGGTRYGGYRPQGFLLNGLELGMWMTAASFLAYWMWATGAVRRLWDFPFSWALVVLLVVTVLCKSTGALVLLALGISALWTVRRTGWALPVWLLIAVAPFYEVTRASSLWSAREFVGLSRSAFGAERAESFEFRLVNEEMLAARALERPLFGWAGYGRAFVTNASGKALSITDGYWIITLGNQGIVGLSAVTAMFLLPPGLLLLRYPVKEWSTPAVAPAAAIAVLLCLYMIDNLSNAMLSPIYGLAFGGLTALRRERTGVDDREGDEVGGPEATGRGPSGLASARAGGDRMAPVLPTWDDEASRADRQRELAERFAAAGYPEEAERAWRRALDLRQARASAAPGDRGARRMLALEHERFGRFLKDRGKPGEAAILWQTALDLLAETGPETDPADPPDSAAARVELCNNLAWLLANGPDRDSRDPARAVALALTAVEAEPGSATYWNTLGVSHYRAGDSRAAIDALGRAVALGSRGTGFDHLFLAMAHASLGDDAPARDWLRRAETWINSQQSDHFELRQLREEAEDLLRLRSSG